MEFHETRGGHEFYYGTMPKIARALDSLSKGKEQCFDFVGNNSDSVSVMSLLTSKKEEGWNFSKTIMVSDGFIFVFEKGGE